MQFLCKIEKTTRMGQMSYVCEAYKDRKRSIQEKKVG